MKEEKKKVKKEREENYDDVERSTDASMHFSEDEIRKMRELAKRLSQKMEKEKMKSFMKSADSKTGSGGSGSDSAEKSNQSVNLTSSGSHGNGEKSKKVLNVASSDSRSNSPLEANQYNPPGSLKHFKIKKRSSGELNVSDTKSENENSSKVVEQTQSIPKQSSESSAREVGHERHKYKSGQKRSRESDDHRSSKLKKKKHKRKDAST